MCKSQFFRGLKYDNLFPGSPTNNEGISLYRQKLNNKFWVFFFFVVVVFYPFLIGEIKLCSFFFFKDICQHTNQSKKIIILVYVANNTWPIW